MALLIAQISGDVADRLNKLVAQTGDLELALTQLINREPHDHQHECPTCHNLAISREARPIDGQLSLLDVLVG